MRFKDWSYKGQTAALSIILYINGSLSVSATLTEFSTHSLSSPKNLHEVYLAAARANALDFGFSGTFDFIQFIKVLVGIFQRFFLIFPNSIGLKCFHAGPPYSGGQNKR